MAKRQKEYRLYFYISKYRNIFKKIMVMYMVSFVCILYLFYKISTRLEPEYFAASESGKLNKLISYSEKQAIEYINSYKNKDA